MINVKRCLFKCTRRRAVWIVVHGYRLFIAWSKPILHSEAFTCIVFRSVIYTRIFHTINSVSVTLSNCSAPFKPFFAFPISFNPFSDVARGRVP